MLQCASSPTYYSHDWPSEDVMLFSCIETLQNVEMQGSNSLQFYLVGKNACLFFGCGNGHGGLQDVQGIFQGQDSQKQK